MNGFVVGKRSRPVIAPWISSAILLGFIGITRMDVRMERRLEIAEDRVIDSHCLRDLQDCIAEAPQILHELIARLRLERIQMRYDWIW